jgi:hypothetical protein
MKQLFGGISIHEKTSGYAAMFCSDSDQSNIATISYWSEDESSRAITFELIPKKIDVFELRPLIFYRSTENDGLYAPKLTNDEISALREFQGELRIEPGGVYRGEWKLDNESGNFAFLEEKFVSKKSGVNPTICRTWNEFKDWASNLRNNVTSCAFRGHGSNEWPLATTINRAGRTRLERYVDHTIQQFRLHAEVALDREFSLENPNEYATLLGLAQHHGLPTPLLDITDSPYVAAYFAFSDAVENKRPQGSFVRIYAVSDKYLSSKSTNSLALAAGKPYIKPLSVSPRHNPRLYAQQGRFLVTNLVDVEAFLLAESTARPQPILFAADIPTSCAFEALQDLKYMGLTAGSLFPGLDGISRMIKQMMMVSDTKHQLDLLPKLDGSPAPNNLAEGAG